MYKRPQNIGLLGVPISKGQMKAGVSCAVKLFRKTQIVNNIEKFGLFVHDFGDLELVDLENDPDILNSRYPRTFVANSLRLSKKVRDILNDDRMVVTIGGDHSLSTGSIHGHAGVSGEVSVVWVDAHADINTPVSSESKNIHGMPLSFIVHEMQNEMPWLEEFKDLFPVLPAKNLAYIGLRDVDPFERYVIEKYNIKNYSMEDIDRIGINCVMEEVIKAINPKLDKEIHLSFDIDALDPIYAPSTGTPVSGGMSLREGMYICEQLYNTGKLRVVDLAEINTQLLSYSDAITTLNSGRKLMLACLGAKRCGHAHIDPKYYQWKTLSKSRNDVYSRKSSLN